MPVNVQLAFQGGGAKICDLLAAAEVVEQLWNDGRLNVTRVAGTSAGSIVACILGSDKSAASFKQLLEGNARDYLKKIVPDHIARALQPAANSRRLTRW